jgi:hypothetical protein
MRGWLRNFSLLVYAVVIATLGACDQTQPVSTLPSSMVLEHYAKAGDLIWSKEIGDKDQLYAKLTRLVVDDRRAWSPNITTYVPGPYIFRSEHLIIMCFSDRLVMDVDDSGKWRSYSRKENALEEFELSPQ